MKKFVLFLESKTIKTVSLGWRKTWQKISAPTSLSHDICNINSYTVVGLDKPAKLVLSSSSSRVKLQSNDITKFYLLVLPLFYVKEKKRKKNTPLHQSNAHQRPHFTSKSKKRKEKKTPLHRFTCERGRTAAAAEPARLEAGPPGRRCAPHGGRTARPPLCPSWRLCLGG